MRWPLALALLAACLVLAWGFGYVQGVKKTELRDAVRAAEDAAILAAHIDRIRALEHALVEASNAAAEAFEEGKQNAAKTSKTVVDDLRAGQLRLQQRWDKCEAARVSDAATAAAQLDAAARDREESVGRIVRAAAECDAQVRALQQLIISERVSHQP